MIHGLKPYSMKDSGTSWLGTVPLHWAVLPNRAIFSEVKERNREDEEMLSVTITRGVIQQKSLLSDTSKKDSSNLDRSAYKLVEPGYVAYNKMRAWQGAIGVSDDRGIVSPAYVVMRLRNDANPRYFHYLYRTPQFAKEAERWSYGITSDMWSLRPEDFRMIYSVLPPRSEQDSIVRFLDYADRRIRSYIRAKQKLIKLLDEQKQAIIHRAVTRGLDPNSHLRPAGLLGLNNIPDTWEIRRLRTLIKSIDQGVSPQAGGLITDDTSWGVLKAGCANRGVFRETEHKRLSKGFNIDERIVVCTGDIIMSRASGSPTLVGSVARVHELNYRLILSDKTFRLNLIEPKLADFLVASMNAPYFRVQVEQAISGAEGLANNLPVSSLKDFRVPLPPVTEAVEIASQLASATIKAGKMLSALQRQIELTHLYRVRLYFDVVTGKLDVRKAVAKLPEEAMEPETLEQLDELSENDADRLEGEAETVSEEAEA